MFSKMITKLSKTAICGGDEQKPENQKILLEYIGMNLTIPSQHRPKNRCYEIYYTAFGGIQKSRVPCYC